MLAGSGFCPNCGTPLAGAGQKFCAECGWTLATSSKAAAAASSEVAPPPAAAAAGATNQPAGAEPAPPWAGAPAPFVPAPVPAPQVAPPWASAGSPATPPPYIAGQAPWAAQPAATPPAKRGPNPVLFLAVIALVVAAAGVGYVAVNNGSKASPTPTFSGIPFDSGALPPRPVITPSARPADPTPTPSAVAVKGGIAFVPSVYSCSSGDVIVMAVALPGSIPGSMQVTAVVDGKEISTSSVQTNFRRDTDGSWMETETDGDGSNTCTLGTGTHTFAVKDPNGKVLAQGTVTLNP